MEASNPFFIGKLCVDPENKYAHPERVQCVRTFERLSYLCTNNVLRLQKGSVTFRPSQEIIADPNNLEEKEKEKQIAKKKEEQTQKEETKIVFVIKGSQHSIAYFCYAYYL